MKRVDISYGGEHYSIGGRDLEDVRDEITTGLASGPVYWLAVNSGEGRHRPSILSLTAGVSISLTSADED